MLDLRELAAYLAVRFRLDKATKMQLDRGVRLMAILKQKQYEPVTVEKQILIIYATINGYLDNCTLDRIDEYEKRINSFMDSKYKNILDDIKQKKIIDDSTKTSLNSALEEFTKNFLDTGK